MSGGHVLPNIPRKLGLGLLCAVALFDLQLYAHRHCRATEMLGQYLRRSADKSCAALDRCVRDNSVERAPDKANSFTDTLRS
jgi:hypothetical protein